MKLQDVIVDDRQRGVFRVHRSTMTSPEIFELERERIFDQCWLYLGHESELRERGDYRRRTIAGRPLIFIRGGDGDVRGLYNTCMHRGARVCRTDQGNAKSFQCFYHAWTYDNTGKLIGVPDEDGYSPSFSKAEFGLKSVPRIDSYRGFWFVSFKRDIDDLRTYLAGATEYLDLVADQSASGMEIVPGSNNYTMKANWKLLMENSCDGYHGVPLHHTFIDYVASYGADWSANLSVAEAKGWDLGNGHGVIEGPAFYGRPLALWHPMFGDDSKEEIAAMRAGLAERCGEERAHRMADNIRLLFIFPNFCLNDVVSLTARQFWPTAPDHLEVRAWALAPSEESPSQRARRLSAFYTFLGPGGFASPDDNEALEACQEGFAVREVEWSDISRGMNRDPLMIDEVQMRAFWREWHARLQGLPHGDHSEGRRVAPEHAYA